MGIRDRLSAHFIRFDREAISGRRTSDRPAPAHPLPVTTTLELISNDPTVVDSCHNSPNAD
jgi:hypothetical protein